MFFTKILCLAIFYLIFLSSISPARAKVIKTTPKFPQPPVPIKIDLESDIPWNIFANIFDTVAFTKAAYKCVKLMKWMIK